MIYDVFMFFNELELLEIRLNALGDFVDKFVLIESTHTYSGIPKPLYFRENKKRFTKWLKKIHVITIEENYPEQDPKQRDTWQRNSICKELKEMTRPQDIMLYSDADEIIDVQAVWDYDVRLGIMGLEMYFAYFYLNAEVIGHRWVDAKIFPAKLLEHATMWDIRYFDAVKFQRMIRNAGWHFSWMGGAERIALKAKSFGHALETEWHWKNPEVVADGLAQIGEAQPTNPIAKFKKLRLLDIDSSFPPYVRENRDELIRRGLIKEI